MLTHAYSAIILFNIINWETIIDLVVRIIHRTLGRTLKINSKIKLIINYDLLPDNIIPIEYYTIMVITSIITRTIYINCIIWNVLNAIGKIKLKK